MSADKPYRLEIAGAQVKIPSNVVARYFFESLGRAVERPPTIVLSGGVPRIGEFWQGQSGVNAGLVRGQNGGSDYYLIVPTDPAAYIKEVAWGGCGEDESGAKCEWDGCVNTRALIDSKHSHPAAERINALRIDGFSDFYLPSRREIRLAWVNVPELFEEGYYWTSTQCSPGSAWGQDFGDGSQGNGVKSIKLRARAVRRLFI